MSQPAGTKCIVVISHQRSGTHFTIDTLKNNLQGAIFHPLRRGASPGPDHLLLGHDKEFFQRFHSYVFRTDGRICLLKSHLLPDEFEAALDTKALDSSVRDLIRHIYAGAAKVYVVRDVRDVMVSYYHFTKNGAGLYLGARDRNEKAGFSEFIRMHNDYVMPVRRFEDYDRNRVRYWAHHARAWMGRKDVVSVTYEQLSLNWAGAVKALAGQLGLQAQLKSTLAKPKFKKLTLPQKIIGKLAARFDVTRDSSSSAVLPRKGVSGDWANYFSDDDLEFVRREIGAEAAQLGYHLLK